VSRVKACPEKPDAGSGVVRMSRLVGSVIGLRNMFRGNTPGTENPWSGTGEEKLKDKIFL